MKNAFCITGFYRPVKELVKKDTCRISVKADDGFLNINDYE